jgi:hypothetical protein
LQTPKQLFEIENICINNLPLQVVLAVRMCFKVELLLHPIPISLCYLGKEISTSIIWVWVQGMANYTHHGIVFFKIDKAHCKI